MAELTYAERLGQSKDEKDASMRAQDVRRAENSLNATIIDTEGQVTDANAAVNSALNVFPVNWANVVRVKRERAIAQDNLEQLNLLKSELFSSKK